MDDSDILNEPKSYPKHVWLIVISYLFERFCFYGIRVVLQTYLALQLGLSFNLAGSVYHAHAMVSYFTPILGAIVADSFIGRYWTVVILSVLYIIGNLVLSGATITSSSTLLVLSLIGVFMNAFGAGAIKPCLSAFGADQFAKSMVKQREQFFSFFYAAINIGALVAQFLTPYLKGILLICFEIFHNFSFFFYSHSML